MDDLFLVINEAGMIESASPAAAATFGYSVADLCGQPWSRVLFVPDHDHTNPRGAFWITASQSPLLHGLHRSGRQFPLRLTEHEIHGAERTHFILFLRDPALAVPAGGIFSKHRELHELAERQGRISVWEVDYRTNHFEFSPVLAEILALPADQVPTSIVGWAKLFHADDWQNLERQAERMLRRELSEVNVGCRVFHIDGSILWMLVRGQASFDETGQPVKAIGTAIDITDRKKAEAERDLFFSLSLDLLCIADMTGFFRRVNPAFCKTLGYTEDELTSNSFFHFLHPDDLCATKEAMAVLDRGENLHGFENRYRCKDGSWRWLSWTCSAPAPGSDRLYAVARDVTGAKQAEADLQRAMRSADQANRAKSEFLSRMSHELRTPLNAILGFGQLLQREPLTDRQRQQIDMIVGGGRHLLTLINEVLDIARIEAGRLDLSPEPVDVASLLHETTSLAQPMADERGIQMTVDLPTGEGPSVLADKQRLKQVLLNLLANAIKYNADGGRVRVFGEAVAADRFRIHVADTGPGIASDKQRRLFTPFDRLGAETSAIEGTGLGLVLSQRLTEIMGGTLTFVSRVDAGSTFTVELARQQPADSVQIVAGAPAPPVPTVAIPRRTLLYIEDNLTNVKLIEAVLGYRPGIRLVTAMQGGIGLDLARQHHPDLILLDVHLPDMHGRQVMAILRAEPALKPIPVVVISADATTHQIESLLAAGAREYLTKPIDVELFLRIVDRYLQG